MTVQILIGAVVTAVAGIGIAYNMGYRSGETAGTASALNAQAIATQAANSASNAAIEAIKGIRIENKYTTQKLDTIIKRETVYRECRHEPDTVRLLNDSLTGTR